MNTERLSDLQYLRDFEFSSSSPYHVWTFVYFLWHFSSFPGYGLHVCLPPVTPMSLRCEPVFFSNLAIWRNSCSLHLSIHSLAFLRAFFLHNFLPQFVFGFCYRTSLLYAQPTLMFLSTCMSAGHWVCTVFVVSCSPWPLTCTSTNVFQRICFSYEPIACAAPWCTNFGEYYEDPSRCLLQFECSVLTYGSAVRNYFVTESSVPREAGATLTEATQQLHELRFLPLSIRGGLSSRLASCLWLPSGVAHQAPLPERWC